MGNLRVLKFESCVWKALSSHSSHHPQEVLLAKFSQCVHKGSLKPHIFIHSCIHSSCSACTILHGMIFNGRKHSSFYYGSDKAVLAFSLCQFGEFRVHSIHSLEREKSEMFSSQMSRHEKQLVHSLKTCDSWVEGWVSEALLFDFIWVAIEINNNWPLFMWAVNDVCLKIKSSHNLFTILYPYRIQGI